MMKKKLSLRRDTLRNLSHDALVDGAGPNTTGCSFTVCTGCVSKGYDTNCVCKTINTSCIC